jgi:hypothetical protein
MVKIKNATKDTANITTIRLKITGMRITNTIPHRIARKSACQFIRKYAFAVFYKRYTYETAVPYH